MSITAVAIIGGVAMVGYGVLNIVALDLMWSLQKWGNSWEGLRSERTGWWEARRVLGGLVLIVVGLAFTYIGFSLD